MRKNTKKFISFSIAMIMTLSSLSVAPVVTNAAEISADSSVSYGEEYTQNGFKYTVDTYNSTATVTGYSGTNTNLVIPSTLGGYKVTKIGFSAFKNNNSIVSLKIPNSVEEISDSAFSGCLSLSSVSLGNNLKRIGSYAFYQNKGLLSIVIPNSVTRIDGSAFTECSKLATVSIGNSVNTMYRNVFENCTSLKKVTIAYGTTVIGDGAFKNCISLNSISIPNSVTKIGEWSFSECSALKSVNIPDSVKEIGDCAFAYDTGISNLSIGKGLVSVGNGAFSNVKKITTLTLPNSLVKIKMNAFENCTGLTSVSIGNSVNAMDMGAFKDCTSLKNVTIAYGTTVIGESAFDGCTSLASVSIPNSITSIGSQAFDDCKKLTNVTIPNSVKTIGSNAFYNCTGITQLSLSEGLVTIGSDAFQNNTGIKKLVIPDSVTEIGWEAFKGCTNLATVSIGNSVSKMENGVFRDCSSLVKVKIADGTTVIGREAFVNCTSLTDIEIPETVNRIGYVRINDDSLIDKDGFFGYTAFENTPKTFAIHGKSGSFANQYAKANNFKFSTAPVSLEITPTSVALNKTTLTLDTGKTSNLKATVYPSNVANKKCTWSSSNTSVATVDSNGKVTAKKAGTATITVKTSNGKTATCKVTVNLPAPQITGLANTTGGIKISWNKVDGAYGYRLYYKPVSGGWKRFKDTTATSFTDSGVVPNKTETYTIRCIDKNGNTISGFNSTGWSKKYTPVAPTITRLSNTSKGVSVTWNKIAGVYGYRLYYKTSSGGWKRFKDTTATSFTDSGVSPNRTETYTIRCIDKNGNTVSGFYSKGWSKKYTPVAPTITRLSNTSKGVSVTWNKIAGVYGYRLYYKTSSGGWKRFKDTTATSFTDSGVSPNRTETYTIRCIDKNGNTVSGFYSKGWSKKYTPVAPTITRLSNTSKGVSVTWNKIAGVYGYRLYRKYDGGSWTRVKDTTSTSFTDSGAKKGKKVTYTVRCIDRKGKTVSGFHSKGWSITRK